MTRERKKAVKSFSVSEDVLAELRRVAEESAIVGGMSLIVNDAICLWLKKYRESPKVWLNARGVPIQGKPQDNDEI